MPNVIVKNQLGIDSIPYKVYRRASDGFQTFQREKLKRGITTQQIEFGLGILEILLVLRFLFDLFNASTLNLLAQLDYAVTFVFIAPFWGLFGRNPSYALSSGELETLAAMLIYPLVVWAAIGLFKLRKQGPSQRLDLNP